VSPSTPKVPEKSPQCVLLLRFPHTSRTKLTSLSSKENYDFSSIFWYSNQQLYNERHHSSGELVSGHTTPVAIYASVTRNAYGPHIRSGFHTLSSICQHLLHPGFRYSRYLLKCHPSYGQHRSGFNTFPISRAKTCFIQDLQSSSAQMSSILRSTSFWLQHFSTL